VENGGCRSPDEQAEPLIGFQKKGKAEGPGKVRKKGGEMDAHYKQHWE